MYGKLGNVFNRVGKFEEAIENYRLQLRFAMEDGNRSQEAQALESLGNLYLFHSQFGDLKTAVDYLERSLKVFIELDDKSGIGHAYGYLGIAFHRLGDLETALNYHQKNLTIVMQLGEKAEEGKTYGNIGRVYRSLCDFNQAINYHELQLSIARNKTRKVDEAIARYDLACNYESLADSARESPTESVESPAESRESPAEFRQSPMKSRESSAESRESPAVFRESPAEFRQSLVKSRESSAEPRESPAVFRESQAEYLTQAREHYQLCAKLLNDVRPRHRGIAQNSTFNDEWKINLFDEYKHVYSDLCRVLSKVHLNWEALLEADKGRAQALRDYMESRYQIETVQPFSSEQDGTASDIYGDIQANTVYLAIDTDTINVWLLMPGHEVRFEKRPLHITSNAVDFLRTLIANAYSRCNVFVPLRGFHGSLQLGGNSLDDEESNLSDQSTVLGIDELGKKEGEIGSSFLSDRSPLQDEEEFNLSDKSTTHDIENLDQKEKHTGSSFLLDGSPLHDDEELNQSDKSTAHDIEKLGHQETMIGQVNPFRTLYDVIFGPIIDHLQGDEIVIVPEGPLCLAPFAAFVAPDSRFLCESFRIRVIPSLASLKLISQGDHSESGALLVGDPDVQEVVRIGGTQVVLNPLPFARKEVLMIGRLLNIEPVIGATATKMEVLDRMTSAALIHIAAHASSESGEIALTPNPTRPFQVPNEEDFLLTMAEILNVQVRAQLVVLSCCHSGRGEIRAEGVVGIVRGFLAAGARSVLVTLWAIDDEVTLMFMEIFYDHLVKGRSSCEALNEAMRHLRESDSFSDVRHWAPFVLIGDDVTLTLPL